METGIPDTETTIDWLDYASNQSGYGFLTAG